MTKKPLKVYIHGAISRTKDIEKLFEKLGVTNPMEYKFGNPLLIYYVNQNNEIAFTEPGTDLYYVITNSSDWIEMKLKQPKKTHKFLITIKDGSGSCDGCELLNKCSDTQKAKCQLASCISELTDYKELTGKVLEINELAD